MNEPQETPPKDKDPKRSTKEVSRELMHLAEQHEKQKAAQQTPDETPQGDDMPIEPDLNDVERRVRQLESHRAYTEERFTRHTQRLDAHDLRLDGIMSREQLGAFFDEKTRAHWVGIDQEYMRIAALVDDISGKYGKAAFAMEKVNAMEEKIGEVLTSMHTRDQRQQESIAAQKQSVDAMNAMADTFASGYIALMGIDPRKPELPRLKSSVIDEMEKLEAEIKVAKERAELAEKHVDDMRVIQAGFTGQFQGENGLFAEIRDMRDYFDKKRQREELVSDVLRGFKDLLKVPAFQAVVGAIVGTTAAGVFIKAVEVLSGVLF